MESNNKKIKDIFEVYCLGSIPVDAGRLCFYDLKEKSIKNSLNERKLVKQIKENKKIKPINTNSFDVSCFADGAYPCYVVVDQFKQIKKIFFELTNSCGWGSGLFENKKTRESKLANEIIAKKKVPDDIQMDMVVGAKLSVDFKLNHRLSYTPWSHFNFIFNETKFLKKKKNKKLKLCNLKISSNALVVDDYPDISREDLSMLKIHTRPETLTWPFPVKERIVVPMENNTYPVYLYYSEKSDKEIIKDIKGNKNFGLSEPMFPILSIENLNGIRVEKEANSSLSIRRQRKGSISSHFLEKVNFFEPDSETNAEKHITICQLDLSDFTSLRLLEYIKPKLDTLELRHLYHIEDWSNLLKVPDVKTLKFLNCNKLNPKDKRKNSWWDVVTKFYYNRKKNKELKKFGNLQVIVNENKIFK